ncbi:MAG TPA: hypothetical protein VF738_00850 [Rhodanobacter sp.]
MSDCRRARIRGGRFFFTVVTRHREPWLAGTNAPAQLRLVFRETIPWDWPHDSFRRTVERDWHPADWGAAEPHDVPVENGE